MTVNSDSRLTCSASADRVPHHNFRNVDPAFLSAECYWRAFSLLIEPTIEAFPAL